MDRREFLKTTFAASAATVALSAEGTLPRIPFSQLPAEGVRIETDGRIVHAQQNGTITEILPARGTSSTGLDVIAQHLLRRLSQRLKADGHATTLAEHDVTHPAGERRWGHDGCKLGQVISAYRPGPETFEGPQLVTLSDQVSAVWVVPSHRTGARAEHYSVVEDALHNIPEVDPDPVDLARLEPIVDHLYAQIMRRGLNVFSDGLYMPQFGSGPACEGSVGFASRDYGLAMRVVRCLGPEELLMRADLIGGIFPFPSTT